MAQNSFEMKIDFEPLKQSLRDYLIAGEWGEMWENYCYENNVPVEIKLGFLDYISKEIEEITK